MKQLSVTPDELVPIYETLDSVLDPVYVQCPFWERKMVKVEKITTKEAKKERKTRRKVRTILKNDFLFKWKSLYMYW